MLDRPPEELLDVATRTVDLAVRALRGSPAPGVLSAKGDRDYASEVDFNIERLVREYLAAATPEIAFLGEEEGTASRAAQCLWVLDPIDGTVNFVHGLPLYAISWRSSQMTSPS